MAKAQVYVDGEYQRRTVDVPTARGPVAALIARAKAARDGIPNAIVTLPGGETYRVTGINSGQRAEKVGE